MKNEYFNFTISAHFVNEINFANPEGIRSLNGEEAPTVEVNVHVDSSPLSEYFYESKLIIKFNATRKLIKDGTSEAEQVIAFIGYISYSTIVNIIYPKDLLLANLEEKEEMERRERLRFTLMVEAPNLAFPFIRHQVANITKDGGFPPLLINPIDFTEMYYKNTIDAENQE
ncbi:protein-export chaperone SecB [Fulvivirgaceae bacterium PWU5]|uniref:Protein-export chaperone SecB n=1 Tax=Dawidia cretensis TaxID=2782350 RepID=A0AAP2DWN6_9BACT|nr:protein-export chaperone SecB [Dawidia cretensis]MBT1708965.1 protein-export chaperone SecB [Dawidia cretensis]